MTTPNDVHNRVSGELLESLFRDSKVGDRRATSAEICVILESLVFGALLALEVIDGVSRATTVATVKSMAQEVERRLDAASSAAALAASARRRVQ